MFIQWWSRLVKKFRKNNSLQERKKLDDTIYWPVGYESCINIDFATEYNSMKSWLCLFVLHSISLEDLHS